VTWSYEAASLATSTLYQVRLELQDTDVTEQLLQDEEIEFLLTQESNLLLTCARGAEIIARLFARQADRVENPTVKLSFTTRVAAYQTLATTLRTRASASHAPVSVSTSMANKLAVAQNRDKTGPYFHKGMQSRETASTDSGFARGDDRIYE
jgi:hypothetical protein